MKSVSNVPWSSIASLILAAGAVVNPLDIIPMVAAVDDALVAPALIVLAFVQFRKWKANQHQMQAQYVDVHPKY